MKVKSKDDRKIFINICQSDIVAKASTTPGRQSDGKGDHWSIPYSLTTIREDIDHGKCLELGTNDALISTQNRCQDFCLISISLSPKKL